MKLSKLEFCIDQPIESAAIQNLTEEVACLQPKIRWNRFVVTLLTWVIAISAMLFIYLAVKYKSELPPASPLILLALLVVWLYRIAVSNKMNDCSQKAKDSLRTADTKLVGAHIEDLMRDRQCRRYIQAVGAQNRKLLTLEVMGMQAYCDRKEESEKLVQTRKKLDAAGLKGYAEHVN